MIRHAIRGWVRGKIMQPHMFSACSLHRMAGRVLGADCTLSSGLNPYLTTRSKVRRALEIAAATACLGPGLRPAAARPISFRSSARGTTRGDMLDIEDLGEEQGRCSHYTAPPARRSPAARLHNLSGHVNYRRRLGTRSQDCYTWCVRRIAA